MQVGADSTALQRQYDPIARANTAIGNSGNSGSDKAIAATTGFAATHDSITHEGNKAQGQGDKAVNNLQTALANPDSALINHFHATGGRLNPHGTKDQKGHNSNDRTPQNLSQLLSKGDSAASTALSRYTAPSDKTRVDDKYISPKLKQERNSALLAFSSGAITTPKKAKSKDLEDNRHPLEGDKNEKSFVARTFGKAKAATQEALGEALHLIS